MNLFLRWFHNIRKIVARGSLVMEPAPLFNNRTDAGIQLAKKLGHYAARGAVVLGLPRGGVPVAYEIARSLKAPLDIFLVRKLGVPSQPEMAMGAIASGGVTILNEDIIESLNISDKAVENVTIKEQKEISRRESLYRGNRSFPNLNKQVVLLVDDGLATGATMLAAIYGVASYTPRKIVAVVPVSSRGAAAYISRQVDEFVCLSYPEPFYGVGAWYADFTQVTDEEVCNLLE